MKKNLLSLIILVLLVVNIALTGVMMLFSMNANKKTAALVDKIAAILDLEVSGKAAASAEKVSIFDTDTYNIADEMIIALKPGGDNAEHYAMVSVSFSLDKTHEDYAQYQPLISEKESKICSEIYTIVGNYTKDEMAANPNAVANVILEDLQTMFDSEFIYEVYFRDIKFQ